MAISKFWLDVFGEKMGEEGRLVALQSLSTNEKDTSPSNVQSNEPFSKFLRQQIAISKFISRCISGKYQVCVCGVSTLPSL